MAAPIGVSGPWTSLKLFPESVPHLLHWDLAYLWLLQRAPSMRPAEWSERCDSWRRLLAHFLLNDLDVERTPISEPFLRFTEPYGIREVAKLFYKGTLVGVLSPVVIVRPLPDAEPALPELPDIPAERAPELQYVLEVLQRQLSELTNVDGERPLQRDLLGVIQNIAASIRVPEGVRSNVRWELRHEPAGFLRRLSFDPDQDEHEMDASDISISTGRQIRLYVPLCRQCGRSLAQEAVPVTTIDVDGPVIELTCPNQHANQLRLESLFIWVRGGEGTRTPTTICWTDREENFHTLESPATTEFPPLGSNTGTNVTFQWDGAQMPNGDSHRVWLRLRFPNEVKALSVFRDAFYPKLLVPGHKGADFKGLPVRHVWSGAWVSHSRMEVKESAIWYHGVQIAGLPFRFSHLCVPGRTDLQPQLAGAIYPKRMHSGWHLYRVMALGPSGRECRVVTSDGRALLPHVVETPGWPAIVSIEKDAQQGEFSGATWKTSEDTGLRQQVGNPRLCLGVDFGTTNTVIYFQERNPGLLVHSRDNGVSVRDFPKLVHWLDATPSGDLARGWFLPQDPKPKQDEHLMPSALWRTGSSGPCFVRWNPEPPVPGCTMERAFKWDSDIVSQRVLREAYLKELLFYSLPVILERLHARGTAPALDIGFAYPLAFDYAKRKDFSEMIQSLCDWLRESGGFESIPYTVNESLASVRAHGAFNPDDLFLVADMGGRTLDVALFSYRSNPMQQTDPQYMHQIGSVEFGGELFLKSAAHQNAGSAHDEEQAYWILRDSIADGMATSLNQDGRIRALLDRFQPMALEFVRVLLAAFRDTHPAAATNARIEAGDKDNWVLHEGGTKSIRVLFVGNGWRLRELMAGGRDPANIFREYFANVLRTFGMEQVELGETAVQGITNSKHWVACGALYTAKDPPPLDRRQSESLTRLPAGITFDVGGGAVKWSTLLGDGGWACPSPAAVATQSIHFERNSGPELSPGWAALMQDCFPPGVDRLPTDGILRQALITCFDNPPRFRKGPLTITLESYWTHLLCPR